jgi:hypothetical protein
MAISQELFCTQTPLWQTSKVITYLAVISVAYVSRSVGKQLDINPMALRPN